MIFKVTLRASCGGEGAEVVYPLRSTDVLARNILEAIGEEGQIMRKYYQRRLPEDPAKDYYYIMRETPNTTSLLLEYGFIDNPKDVVKLQNYLLDYVEAVVRAVTNYIGVPYIAPDGTLENAYTVQAGDTLYSIARRFNITVAQLKALNNLTSDALSIGQVLIISEEINIPPQPEDAIIYTVQNGDTLYSIANRYGVTVAEIIELNDLSTTVLSVGQQLLIPNKSTDIITTYTVKAGDTLYSIASQFGITVDDIISSNNLSSTTLQIGQILTIPTGTKPTPPQPNFITYTVKAGDSLWKIASQYELTVNDIINANNLTNTTLQIGQVLTIPIEATVPAPPPPIEENYINYTVKSGDSLWAIANRYNTTVDAIKQLNNLASNNLSIGQVLKIPTQEGYINYYVQSGDSLWTIANRYGTTVNQIKQLNGLNNNNLSIGQLLIIPT